MHWVSSMKQEPYSLVRGKDRVYLNCPPEIQVLSLSRKVSKRVETYMKPDGKAGT